MSYNYTLKYKTFDQLLADIQIDFQNLSLQNMIEPQQLVKIAKRVSYDLGLRVLMTKEALLDVEKGRVKLPDDFFTLNFALICDEVTVHQAMPQGTNMQEVKLVPPYQETPAVINPCTDGPVNCQSCQAPVTTCGCPGPTPSACSTAEYNPLVPYGDACVKPRVFLNCKNDCYELVQIIKTEQHTFKRLYPITLQENPETIDCNCPNLYMHAPNKAWIQNGYLYTNFASGKVYINYQGLLEDSEGNLLVIDHDEITTYYEYAIKQRILENLVMNDEPVGQKLQLVEARLREARNRALSIVNTPNFAELKKVWEGNRKAMYAKYYDSFKSYPWNQAFNINAQGQMNRY